MVSSAARIVTEVDSPIQLSLPVSSAPVENAARYVLLASMLTQNHQVLLAKTAQSARRALVMACTTVKTAMLGTSSPLLPRQPALAVLLVSTARKASTILASSVHLGIQVTAQV